MYSLHEILLQCPQVPLQCVYSRLPAPNPKLHRSSMDSNLGLHLCLPRPDSAPGISVHGAGLEAANGIYVRTSFKVRHAQSPNLSQRLHNTARFAQTRFRSAQEISGTNCSHNLMPSFLLTCSGLCRVVHAFPFCFECDTANRSMQVGHNQSLYC